MTEEKSFELRYMGQIITLFALEVLILLVRIAVPINSAIDGAGIQYDWLLTEIIYFAINGFLVVVLTNHLIFKNSYRTMGLNNFKQNAFSLFGNVIYLGLVAGVTLALNYIGGEKHLYTASELLFKLIMVFIGGAFIQEVVYRGCIQKAFIKLTNNFIVAIIGSSILFGITYFVLGLINSGFDPKYMEQIWLGSSVAFCIGAYFGLLYHVTNNLWICVIIHGTYEAINVVGDSFLLYPFKIVYIIIALTYLIYEVIRQRRNNNKNIDEQSNEGLDEELSEALIKELNPEELNKQSIDNHEDVEQYQDIKSENEELQTVKEEDSKDTSENEFNIDLSYQYTERSKEIVKQMVEDEKNESNVNKPKLHKEKIDEFGQTRDVSLVDLNKELSKTQTNSSLKDSISLASNKSNEQFNLNETRDNKNISDQETVKLDINAIDEEYIKHLERSLGTLVDIYPEEIPSNPPISILLFEGNKFNSLVTSGMRQEAMNVPEYLKGDAYAELVMFISKEYDLSKDGMLVEENKWLLDALRELATYPKVTNSYLGWGHTVGNGEGREPYFKDNKLCGMLIYPPVMQDDMTFYTFKEEDKTTYIYNVMPLYKEEMDFILSHSGDLYFTKSKEVGVSQVIEKNRQNVCESDALPVT